MTDYTELIRQLKTYDDGYGLYADAADAIDALQAEVKRLKMHCADCEYGNSPWPEEPVHEPKRGDLVEVVRCKDCRYFYFGFCHNRDGYVKFGAVRDRDWFCADAKKEVQDG